MRPRASPMRTPPLSGIRPAAMRQPPPGRPIPRSALRRSPPAAQGRTAARPPRRSHQATRFPNRPSGPRRPSPRPATARIPRNGTGTHTAHTAGRAPADPPRRRNRPAGSGPHRARRRRRGVFPPPRSNRCRRVRGGIFPSAREPTVRKPGSGRCDSCRDAPTATYRAETLLPRSIFPRAPHRPAAAPPKTSPGHSRCRSR